MGIKWQRVYVVFRAARVVIHPGQTDTAEDRKNNCRVREVPPPPPISSVAAANSQSPSWLDNSPPVGSVEETAAWPVCVTHRR